MKKLILAAIVAMFTAASVNSQELSLLLDARESYIVDDTPAFSMDFLNLTVDGYFAGDFRFSLRQRLNKSMVGPQPLNAWDWSYLQYTSGDWDFAIGKMPIKYGGVEYDQTPINIYFSSVYWWNFGGCYQPSLAVGRWFGDYGLYLGLSRSPFAELISREFNAMKSFNLQFRGNGNRVWTPMWGVNVLEMDPGRFTTHIGIGNKFTFGQSYLWFDVYNRTGLDGFDLFKDWSAVAQTSVHINDYLSLLGKVSYDRNEGIYDKLVPEGTDDLRYGIGLELFPVKGRSDIRFHCIYMHSEGDKLSVGLSWMPNFRFLAGRRDR